MSCCCVKTLNLCNVPVCGSLELDVVATIESGAESGAELIYKLVLDFLNTQITLEQIQAEGENVTFDISMLNENHQYEGKLYNSSGGLVSIESDGETYDCIKFKTVMNVFSY